MYKKLDFTIVGISPLIMHSRRLANPLDSFARDLKALSGKRKKTDADYEEISRVEFFGGLYLDEGQRPVIPGENIEAMLIDGAKKQRLGEQFKAGVLSDGLWPLLYEGPKTAEELWLDKRFVDVRGAVIGTSTIMRTRPIFRGWRLTFSVSFLPEVLNEQQVVDALTVAGRLVGICDHTPKFGRFEVQ